MGYKNLVWPAYGAMESKSEQVHFRCALREASRRTHTPYLSLNPRVKSRDLGQIHREFDFFFRSLLVSNRRVKQKNNAYMFTAFPLSRIHQGSSVQCLRYLLLTQGPVYLKDPLCNWWY
jgi:hypothetical protein